MRSSGTAPGTKKPSETARSLIKLLVYGPCHNSQARSFSFHVGSLFMFAALGIRSPLKL